MVDRFGPHEDPDATSSPFFGISQPAEVEVGEAMESLTGIGLRPTASPYLTGRAAKPFVAVTVVRLEVRVQIL